MGRAWLLGASAVLDFGILSACRGEVWQEDQGCVVLSMTIILEVLGQLQKTWQTSGLLCWPWHVKTLGERMHQLAPRCLLVSKGRPPKDSLVDDISCFFFCRDSVSTWKLLQRFSSVVFRWYALFSCWTCRSLDLALFVPELHF